MWKLKACPRCGGDISIDKLGDSWLEECLQCSYQRELKNLAELEPASPRQEKVPAFVSQGR